MRLQFPAILAVATLLTTSCKKDASDTAIEVHVQAGSGTALSDKSISLLSDDNRVYWNDPKSAKKSDNNGNLTFKVTPGKNYYLYHYADDGKLIYNAEASFIVIGKFSSQQQINTSPGQTPEAKVGDDIYQDVNVDGIINNQDKVLQVSPLAAGKITSVNFLLN